MTFSVDSTVLGQASMFDMMGIAWAMGIPWNNTESAKLPHLDHRTCLEMGTVNGARALGLADITGSLTPGKRADLLIVRATDLTMVPFGEVETVLVNQAALANVDTVAAGGRVLERAG